ncbi:hypothetical protein GCWU000341_00513 [Oribacterium sp. oral taxon 078 str. F0262]|nr:hypothetical protein GCWU000341_00513 [Oribacterium sp. oral taxon 078 str. F0262]
MRISHLISKSKPFWRIILCLKSNYELLKGAIYAGEKTAKETGKISQNAALKLTMII